MANHLSESRIVSSPRRKSDGPHPLPCHSEQSEESFRNRLREDSSACGLRMTGTWAQTDRFAAAPLRPCGPLPRRCCICHRQRSASSPQGELAAEGRLRGCKGTMCKPAYFGRTESSAPATSIHETGFVDSPASVPLCHSEAAGLRIYSGSDCRRFFGHFIPSE